MTTRARRGQRGPKRKVFWMPFYVEGFAVPAGGTATSGDMLARYFLEHGSEVPVGTTIGPIRGVIGVLGATVGQGFDLFGSIHMRPEAGFAVNPSLELEQFPSMWYGQLLSDFSVQEIAATVFAKKRELFLLETKSMRKVREVGEEMRLQLDEVSNDEAVTVDVACMILYKLP